MMGIEEELKKFIQISSPKIVEASWLFKKHSFKGFFYVPGKKLESYHKVNQEFMTRKLDLQS